MKKFAAFAVSVSSLLSIASTANAETDKFVIAHRGASGYVPEHTLEAYAMAYGMGAGYVEQDLVRTKDGAFVCLHDIHLEMTTNVEETFPERKREDGRWYAIDFTLDEIRTLKAHERLPGRFPTGKSDFRVPTFQEAIELVQGLNKTTGRDVGIYPELKDPGFHADAGQPMEEAFLAILKEYGYEGPQAKCFAQCFSRGPLKKMRELGSTLPQVYLMGGDKATLDELTDAGIQEIATFANGIGPDKSLLERDPTLVERAHAAGLVVHPYTVRRDQKPGKYPTTEDELRHIFFTRNVDGLFCDFPDDGVKVLAQGAK